MSLSKSAAMQASEAARATLKASRMVGLAIEGPPEPPTTSWWIGLGRAAFYQRARQEFPRLSRSRFAWVVTGSGPATPAEPQRGLLLRSAGRVDAVHDDGTD